MADAGAMAGLITFAQPAALWALTAAALPALLAWRGRRRGRKTPLAAVIAQSLALTLIAISLANPLAAVGQRAKLPYLLAVDVSDSVRGQSLPVGELAFPPGAQVEQLNFAGGLARADGATEPSATRIAPALRMIAARGQADLAAAIIATDGRFTDADWAGAAQAIAASGADLLILPLSAPPPDGRIADFQAVRRGPNSVEIVVTVAANEAMSRTLTISRAGAAEGLLVRPLALLGGSAATVRTRDTLPADADAEYTARLDGGDAFSENDSAAVIVAPLRRALAAVAAPDPLRKAIASGPAKLHLLAPAELPTRAEELAQLSAMVIFDADGSSLSAAQRSALADYVRNGGGLVMVGTGPHAKPADDRDDLNRVLPLSANPFQRRPLHLFVLLDRSGSMARPAAAPAASQIKFDLAAEATAALADHLTDQDALTVITFAASAWVAYDSGAAGADFAALRGRLAAVKPAGATKVMPAIDLALERTPAPGRRPMLLVLSDLRTEDFDPAAPADKIQRAGAQLAVVAIGEAPDRPGEPPLKALADRLGAPYRQRDHLVGLAEVFAQLVRRGRGEAIRERPTEFVTTAAVFDTGLTDLGRLDAYILSGLRGRSELLARTAGGDPLLASRRVALGRSVSLAACITERLNAAWAATDPAAKLISAAVNWTARAANDPRLDAQLTRIPAGLRIVATATDNDRPVTDLELTAVIAAGGEVSTGLLDQVAPGRYSAEVPCLSDAAAAVEIRDANAAALWHGSATLLYPPEYRHLGPDGDALRRLARLAGGAIVTADELAGRLSNKHQLTLTVLWPWLLAAAAAIMLIEWSLTRITRQ